MPNLTIQVLVKNRVENGWYLQSTNFENERVDLELSAISSEHDTIECLPSKLNTREDWESRNATDLSDWTLQQNVFL